MSHTPPRQYRYVGPPEIKQSVQRENHCIHVADMSDLQRWSREFLPSSSPSAFFTATYIIDIEERLWIADRRSEHVACADGQDVLAAGEITFEHVGKTVEVADVTNLSTGYCPQPACWNVVAHTLDRIGLPRPSCFSTAFAFRRCNRCDMTNVIKDNVFECAACYAPLSPDWNFSA